MLLFKIVSTPFWPWECVTILYQKTFVTCYLKHFQLIVQWQWYYNDISVRSETHLYAKVKIHLQIVNLRTQYVKVKLTQRGGVPTVSRYSSPKRTRVSKRSPLFSRTPPVGRRHRKTRCRILRVKTEQSTLCFSFSHPDLVDTNWSLLLHSRPKCHRSRT